YDHFLPEFVREHRRYFTAEQRGFGEDAFHTMWYVLFEEFRPASALEIGVYRGQTITLWKLLSRYFGFSCRVGCISPFTPAGDAVSQYAERIDYYEDVVCNHARFNLDLPKFSRQLSTTPEARRFALECPWNLIYIDGNHDYEVDRHDW